jgi:hypothetical protein
MSDSSDSGRKRRKFPTNVRRENRHDPNPYMPQTVIYPSGDVKEAVEGVTREESKEGFSASFDLPFPYEEGDVVDVRVGYERVWAKIMWTMEIMEKKAMAGFQRHPRELQSGEAPDKPGE